LADLPKGTEINFENETYILQDEIKAKHKFFIKDMQPGDKVIMYGVLVGTAQTFIPREAGCLRQMLSMPQSHIPGEKLTTIGRHRMCRSSAALPSMDITGLTGLSARQITGCLFPRYFVKTGTLT
jgi:hypothetical protein